MLDVDSSIRWNDVGLSGMTWVLLDVDSSPSLHWGDVPVLG